MSTAQLSPGTVVDGKLTIGAATWARVGAQSYAATDERGQAVVLTAYAPACFSSGLVLERSLRELRQLQTPQSPRVATVLACGKLPDGGIYEVVGPLPAERLDALVARGPLPGPDAASIIEQVGEAVLEAQKAGVIHRDLGPRVVFVGPEGVVVTGFSVGEPHGDKSFGPLDTIAPEQVEGKVVDQRTLIYNLAALMHMLITGTPLFPGDAATQLQAHLATEAPDTVHARLRRALGKDPRMRPMMLKQFVAELRAIGGGAARAPIAPSTGAGQAPPLPGGNLSTGGAAAKPAGAPSSRGWTMFMQGEAGDAPATGAPAAAAAPVSDVPAKPKTRGWTMFMEGADEPEKKAEEKPAAKPSTRGWTMFMEDDEGQAPPAAEAESPVAVEATVAAPAPAAPDGGQPKTRGWTMFMEDDEGQAAPAAAAAPTPVAAAAPTPVAAATPTPVAAPAPAPAVAPPVGGAAVKPSTRGWTMFMKADEETAAEAVAIAEQAAQPEDQTKIYAPPAPPVAAPSVAPPVAAAPSVAPPAAAAPAAPAAAPKSSGWTMFTEATGEHEAQAADSGVEAAPSVEVAAESSASISTSKPRRGDSDAPAKKRGWTMFMEKPLADAKQDPLGGAAPSAGESNAKGWTVFSPAADVQAEVAAARAMVEPQPSEPSGDAMQARDAAPLGAASGQANVAADESGARAQAAADVDRMHAKTVVVTGQPDPSLAARPQTVITPPGSSPAAQPRMMTMVTPDPQGSMSGPAGVVSDPVSMGISGPISTGLSGPISTGISGPVSTGMPVHSGSHAMEPAKKKSSPVPLIVTGVVLVAAAIVGAIVMLN